MSTDPVVRYTAGAILVIAFLAATAIIVHGYWYNQDYAVPAAIQWVVSSAITGALTLLGVHVGNEVRQGATQQGAEIATGVTTNGTHTTQGGK